MLLGSHLTDYGLTKVLFCTGSLASSYDVAEGPTWSGRTPAACIAKIGPETKSHARAFVMLFKASSFLQPSHTMVYLPEKCF